MLPSFALVIIWYEVFAPFPFQSSIPEFVHMWRQDGTEVIKVDRILSCKAVLLTDGLN